MNIIFLFYILNNIFHIIVNQDKNNIKLSIIIPVYNTENYLEQCLDSIINQSLWNKLGIIIHFSDQSDPYIM